MRHAIATLLLLSTAPALVHPALGKEAARPRAREAGVTVGILKPGPLNAITDVAGVEVGQITLPRSHDVNTGVTAILPHGGNLFQDKVPAGFVAYNAFGKFMGSTQVAELGELETPILLTNTLNVAEAAAASVEWTLAQPGNQEVKSVNAVVGETNDGMLNDIRARRVTIADARRAIETAKVGPVAEGAVGAGTGTVAFGYKAGIGTSSRLLPASLGGWTVGVLVQANYGGVLTISGVPVGVKLGQYNYRQQVEEKKADGSVVIVIATDAPLSDRNLRRVAERAFAGIARTGSSFSNGSGDYAIAFSTNPAVRRTADRRDKVANYEDLSNDRVSPLFQATIEATEEAVLNALFRAETVVGHSGTAQALPLERILPMLKKAAAE